MSAPTHVMTSRRETHAQATSRKTGGQNKTPAPPKGARETEPPPESSGKRGAGNRKTRGKSPVRKLSIATSQKNKGATLAKGARKGTKRLSVSA